MDSSDDFNEEERRFKISLLELIIHKGYLK